MPDPTYTLSWDGSGQKKFENGVSRGVLYRKTGSTTGKEWEGVAWNGLTSVSESPEGADPQEFYADNILYALLRSAEKYGGTIEAYTYPEEFEYCNGETRPSGTVGMSIGQQAREVFRFCYRTEQGTDENPEAGYKLHLVYGATCSPSDRTHESVNDNPDLDNPSWDFKCVPVEFSGHKPVAHIVIDSMDFTTDTQKALLAALEAKLYGNGTNAAYMPDPSEVATTLTPSG